MAGTENGPGLLDAIWMKGCPVVGMVHLLPLPGSPGFRGSMEEILDRAVTDARHLDHGGLDGVLVENYGDTPFFPDRAPSVSIAAMATAVREVVRATTIPVGVNVLRNDAGGALAVAVAAGGRFIRVNVHTGSMYTDQGLIQGQAHQTLRERQALGVNVAILADVMVKHATPPPGLTLESAARDSWLRGKADGLILTGTETGLALDSQTLRPLRDALPSHAKLWVGSGATPESARELSEMSDGMIVGSSLQEGGVAGGGVDPGRVGTFMAALGD